MGQHVKVVFSEVNMTKFNINCIELKDFLRLPNEFNNVNWLLSCKDALHQGLNCDDRPILE